MLKNPLCITDTTIHIFSSHIAKENDYYRVIRLTSYRIPDHQLASEQVILLGWIWKKYFYGIRLCMLKKILKVNFCQPYILYILSSSTFKAG